MKKSFTLVFAVALIAFTTNRVFGQTITYCPNSSVICTVTVTNPDGSSITVTSEKGKKDGAVIMQWQIVGKCQNKKAA